MYSRRIIMYYMYIVLFNRVDVCINALKRETSGLQKYIVHADSIIRDYLNPIYSF